MPSKAIERLVLNVAPALLLVVLLGVFLGQQQSSGGSGFLPSDVAYDNLVVARNLINADTYGLMPGIASPAVHDVLWRFLLWPLLHIFPNAVAAAVVLGCLCAFGTVLLLARLCALLFDYLPFVLCAVCALVMSPPFLIGAASGTALPLTTFLVTTAVLLHVRGLQKTDGVGLSFSLAAVVGLLCLIRVEFALLWIVFGVHVFLLSFFGRTSRGRESSVVPVLLFLQGLFVLALCIFPLLLRNVQLLGVPWPHLPGAAMGTSALTEGNLNSGIADVLHAFPRLVAVLYRAPFLSSGIGTVLFLIGAVVLAIRAWSNENARPFTIVLFLPLLLLPLLALLVPFMGMSAANVMFASFGPLAALAGVYGLFGAYPLFQKMLRKLVPRAFGKPRFNTWWITCCSVMFLVLLIFLVVGIANYSGEVRSRATTRQELVNVITERAMQNDIFVTDMPGWLIWNYPTARTLDLHGEAFPELLTAVGLDGDFDSDVLGVLFSRHNPTAILLESPSNAFIEDMFQTQVVYENTDDAGDGIYPRLLSIH